MMNSKEEFKMQYEFAYNLKNRMIGFQKNIK